MYSREDIIIDWSMTITNNKDIFYKVFQHYKVCQTNTQVIET